jgi:hypothetical protein
MNDVLRAYAEAYDRHAETEQVLVAVGEYDRAAEAHERAMVALRAYKAELDDPEPRETCACVQCGLYRVGIRRVT